MKRFFCIYFFFSSFLLFAQEQTVGLFSIESNSFEGYTLFAPIRSTSTYLIDHCGNLVNEWVSAYTPGNSAYLLENGHLLKACRMPGIPPVNGAGYGGIVQILDWDSNVVWEYWYANDTVIHHHDVSYMPNGNVLILAWEVKTMEEAIEAGRNPGVVTEAGVYPVHVVEVEPIGQDSGTIIWKWHVWDHLVQDYDFEKSNFGVVGDHPELIDLNYHPANNGTDWLHCNSIDYNPVLDQIMISSRFNDEIYVIDHSTTTEEAAGHTGGNSGKGGDILYRWGNPVVYDRGDENDQIFYRQHDASWIPAGLPDEGKIMVFNNGFGQPVPDFSSIEMISPPTDGNGNYIIGNGQPFGPEDSETVYVAADPTSFFTIFMGSVQQQPNGNLLICDSPAGRFFEVDQSGNIVWEYINPASGGGIITQGDPIPTGSGLGVDVFRCYRYPPDYPGLAGVDLTPGEPIEINPYDYECPLTVSVEQNTEKNGFTIYPNPASEWLYVDLSSGVDSHVRIFDVQGKLVFSNHLSLTGNAGIDISMFRAGVYLLSVEGAGVRKFIVDSY